MIDRDTIRLSIIVPVYNMNSGGKLQYCLDSLMKQKMDYYEVIAVDDKSTDDSLAVLREYEKQYPDRLRVIASPENQRQGGAKNLGLQAAGGAWIGFIDSDDWVSEEMFCKLLDKADETGADIVGCNYLITDETGKEEGLAVRNNEAGQTGLLDDEKYRKLIIQPGSMVIKIYKRELFKENALQFPEKIFYEDNAIGVLPLLYAKRFEVVDESLYFYYQHSTSTVHTINMDRCRDRIRAAEIYLKECQDRGFYNRFKAEIDYKVFELGYRNTLFSYLQDVKKPEHGFVEELKQFLKENVPGFESNPYYLQYMDEENQKLIHMHMKNTRFFLYYYKLLQTYRKIRYGK